MASKPRKVKAPKDLNAPKKNLSAYFIFTNKRRQELKVQYPEKKLTELTTLMAVEWKAMDEETKKGYQAQAIADKENYTRQMEEYKKTSNYTQSGQTVRFQGGTEIDRGHKGGQKTERSQCAKETSNRVLPVYEQDSKGHHCGQPGNEDHSTRQGDGTEMEGDF